MGTIIQERHKAFYFKITPLDETKTTIKRYTFHKVLFATLVDPSRTLTSFFPH